MKHFILLIGLLISLSAHAQKEGNCIIIIQDATISEVSKHLTKNGYTYRMYGNMLITDPQTVLSTGMTIRDTVIRYGRMCPNQLLVTIYASEVTPERIEAFSSYYYRSCDQEESGQGVYSETTLTGAQLAWLEMHAVIRLMGKKITFN